MYRDVRAAVDLCHRDGSLKRNVAADPGKYIHDVSEYSRKSWGFLIDICFNTSGGGQYDHSTIPHLGHIPSGYVIYINSFDFT
jgi:hypothetical protein